MMKLEQQQEAIKGYYRRIKNLQSRKIKIKNTMKILKELVNNDNLNIDCVGVFLELQDKINNLNNNIEYYKKEIKTLRDGGCE